MLLNEMTAVASRQALYVSYDPQSFTRVKLYIKKAEKGNFNDNLDATID